MTDDKQLFKALYMIQVVAAFLVTAGHYTAGLGSYTTVTAWDTALNHLSRFGTVILAMLTGFFTAHSFIGKNTTAASYLVGKFFYIYLPFLAAGLLYHSVLTTTSFPATLNDWINIAVGRTGGHLYFIFMIMQYYIFALLFRHWITRRNIWWFLIAFIGIQYAFIDYNFYWRGFGVRYFLPTWIFTIYLGHLFYFYRHSVVAFLQKHRPLRYGLLLISVAGTTFFALSTKLYTANHLRFVLFTAILTVTLVLLFLSVVKRFSLPFSKGFTYYIYLLHPYIIIFMNQWFMRKWHWNWILDNQALSFLYLTWIFVATCILSWIISKFIGYFDVSKWWLQRNRELPLAQRRGRAQSRS